MVAYCKFLGISYWVLGIRYSPAPLRLRSGSLEPAEFTEFFTVVSKTSQSDASDAAASVPMGRSHRE